ncbi:MAG: Rpn family recombination-promoting nuclease/putative transposase [Treponema sp.]|nr:Rpn family recombination-promoting nuclease/putative transposase [Treponema sp.]
MTKNTFQIEKWEDLTFANNFLFCKILESEPELCRQLLELLLHIEIDHLEIPQAERTFKETIESKSVRFDVYTKGDNKIFDIEIQTTNKKNLPKRSRYYQSIIDMSNLNAGTDYDELKETYIIFICLNDIFHKGLPLYTFENICNENRDIKLNDRAFKLFFNAANCDKLSSGEQKSFFKFLKGEIADSDFTRLLKDKLYVAKKNAEWRMQYMTWEQTLREEYKLAYKEAYQEAYKEAALENTVENARNLLRLGVSAEIVSQGCSLPLEEVLALTKESGSQAAATGWQ